LNFLGQYTSITGTLQTTKRQQETLVYCSGQGPVNQAEAKERMMAMEAQLRHPPHLLFSISIFS
jgi:hypothetical protein